MKIHKILFLALLLACATSCEEDAPVTTLEDSQSLQDAANDDGSSSATVSWTANGEELASNEPSVSVGGYLTLVDQSEGVVSREWLVSSGDLNSIYFLEGDFKNTTEESDDSKYDAYIDDETTLSGSSSEAEINLYFKAIGSTTMILRSYYNEPVYKKYEDAESGETLFAQSSIDGDLHVIEVPIIVNVNGEGTIDWSAACDGTMTEISMMEYNILKDSSITFNDLSLWNTSHSWSVSGSGVTVKSGSYAGDMVELTFAESGTQTVTIKNYYAASTTCDVDGTSYTTEYSSGYCFAFDIKVNVYDADVVSAFEVYTDEACTNQVTADISVDANTTLYFKDISTGGYSVLTYTGYDDAGTVMDAAANIGGVTAISFANSGDFNAFAQTVTRGVEGVYDAIPDYKTDTETIGFTITVNALEDPVIVNSGATLSATSTAVTVTFDEVSFNAADITANSAEILSAFSLSVENGSYSATLTPTAVAVNADNSSAIDLTFATLYNTDELKLNYTAPDNATDGLKVADGRGVDSFTDLTITTNLLVNPLAEASDFSATGYDLATYFTMCAQTSGAPGTIAHTTGSISLVDAKDVVDTEADGVKWLKITNSTSSGCYMQVSGAGGGTFNVPATTGKEYYSTIEMYMDSDYVSTGYFSLKLTRGSSNWWDSNDSMLNTGSQSAYYDTSLANIGSSWGITYLADNSYTLKSGTYIQFYSEHKDRKFYYLQTAFQGTYYIKSISFTNAVYR